MSKYAVRLWVSLLLVCFGLVTSANEKTDLKKETLYFTSLEWPPYLSSTLPDGGLGLALAKEAFRLQGYEIKVEFFPWSRCLKLVETKSKYIGVLLGYKDAEREKIFIFSDQVMGSPLGFAERVSDPLTWTNFSDLHSKNFGVVQDYVNTKEIDAAIAAKSIKVESAVSDSLNLVKLANKRMDLAVIDINVFDYLMATDTSVAAYKSKLQTNQKTFEEKGLYALFRNNKDGQKYADIFNAGLKKINVKNFLQQYKNAHFNK